MATLGFDRSRFSRTTQGVGMPSVRAAGVALRITGSTPHGLLRLWETPSECHCHRAGITAVSSFRSGPQDSLILYQRPLTVGVVLPERCRHLGSIFAKVLLIYLSVLIDDEGHDSGFIPVLRISDQGESLRHNSIA